MSNRKSTEIERRNKYRKSRGNTQGCFADFRFSSRLVTMEIIIEWIQTLGKARRNREIDTRGGEFRKAVEKTFKATVFSKID